VDYGELSCSLFEVGGQLVTYLESNVRQRSHRLQDLRQDGMAPCSGMSCSYYQGHTIKQEKKQFLSKYKNSHMKRTTHQTHIISKVLEDAVHSL